MRGCGTVFILSLDEHLVIDNIERLANRIQYQADLLKATVAKCRLENSIQGIDIMVAFAFNAQQFTPEYGGGGGLPAGKYKGVIVDSGLENVEKNGQIVGGYMRLDLTPIEGPLAGQKHTDRLNLNHINPTTVGIANKQLAAYCHVTGKYQFQTTEELHNIPFIFEIGPQKNNPEYTEVKAIFDINGNKPGQAGAPAPAAPMAAPPMTAPAGVAPIAAPPAGWAAPAGAPVAPAAPAWGGQPAAAGIDNNVPLPGQPAAPAAPAWGAGAPATGAPAAAPAGWGPR